MPSNKEIAIEVKNIHKEFILPQNKNTTFKQTVVNIVKKNKKITQKVLDGVSFNVNKGDFLGIVGRNGSGKSTLLKLIAGVYAPTAGEIKVNGGLTPFIELGVGFNPELSGRDNVYLNGALLGFNRKQMDEMYDDIVDFAELGQFMDQKLKNYSSGMQVRLAFSIAIKAKNEILIFDEVLAVGDEAFQRKCLDVFEKYRAEKQTVILVTHDMETVKQFCTKAILINDGKIIDIGNPWRVANKYSSLNRDSIDREVEENNSKKCNSNFNVKTIDTKKTRFNVGDDINIKINWPGINNVLSVGVNIFKESGEHVTGMNTLKDGIDIIGKREINICINLPLQPGKYRLLIEAFESVGKRIASIDDGAPRFIITDSETKWSGLTELSHNWSN